MALQRRIIAAFNLGAIAANAISIYRIKNTPIRLPGKPYPIDGTTQDEALYTGSFGNPVFSDLDISNGSYIDNKGGIVNFDGLTVETALFTVQQTKNVVVTAIQGQNGTVKEFISEGDWRINVKGVLVGQNGAYPFEQVDRLKRILSANVALQVNSWYLTQLGIYNLVVTDKSIPQAPGGYSQQIFEFNALSDNPIELF